MKDSNPPVSGLMFIPSCTTMHCHYAVPAGNISEAEEGFEALQSIGEVFSRMFQDARVVTVEEYLGFPKFPKAETLSILEIGDKNRQILEMLYRRRIKIQQAKTYPDPELYSFLTEDLMKQEIYDLEFRALYCTFVYEIIRPDREAELEAAAEEFFFLLLSTDWRFLNGCVTPGAELDGWKILPQKKALQGILAARFPGYIVDRVVLNSSSIGPDDTTVRLPVDVRLRGLQTDITLDITGLEMELVLEEVYWKVQRLSGLLREPSPGG